MKSFNRFVIYFSTLVLLTACGAGQVSGKPDVANSKSAATNTSKTSSDSSPKAKKSSGSQDSNISSSTSNLGKIGDNGNNPVAIPDFIQSQTIIKAIQSDLADAGITCANVDPKKDSLIQLTGNEAAGTLSACQKGDPEGDGFILYVVTEKSFVKKYYADQYVKFFNDFQSPIDGLAENTLFTPSSRAILFVLGGKEAFEASEIAWGSLDDLNLNPPSRD